MTHIDKHSPGSFCWIELATTDQNAAKDFYSSLFGWTADDSPIGPSEFYTIFKLDGRDAAAACTLRWADLSTPDAKRATDFYSGLFGWQIVADEKDKSGYLHIKNGEYFIGGVPPSAHRQPGVPPHWLAYFWVDDIDSSAAKAKQMGAKPYLEPTTIENVGRMAVIADPQGAVLAVFNSPKQ